MVSSSARRAALPPSRAVKPTAAPALRRLSLVPAFPLPPRFVSSVVRRARPGDAAFLEFQDSFQKSIDRSDLRP